MLVLGIAVAVALVLPLVTGGSYTRLVMTDWRWSALLFVGLGLQLGLEFLPLPESRYDDVGFALLVASYALIAAFCARNVLLRGMFVVLIGVACNALVITVNNGMPVDVPPDWEGEAFIDPTVKHHPQDSEDRLTFLGDIIILRAPFDTAISFGDLIIAVGLCDVTYHASRRRKSRRHADTNGSGTPAVQTIDLAAFEDVETPTFARPHPVLPQPTALLVSPTTRSSALNTRSS